ncbi:hypothetical protein EWM64_g60 [Hericium alpestre]|uniref:Folylpolyglutamate synthase n=1 Tax=Hericium alpestre TaxID=135208 RepID=A0A4Z0ADC0_9AGAM|nr:hypothetical protein EWM64_g60 [Hericium alpestre]
MSIRTYKDAIDRLNTLQSNAATLEAVRASGGRQSEFAIPEMVEYLERIGYKQEDLNKLNVIHVAGTKGKGSTSAFANSILHHVKPDWKIAVRERIRINGTSLSEEEFAKYFFEVWDRLEMNDVRKFPQTPAKPAYFRYVTLVAFHTFLTLKVDATILEAGVGGTYDSTNIVPKPIVTGVSALGIDHTAVLGKTLPEIAWQKGGIYKEGVPALTVNQPEEALSVLKQQSIDRKASEFSVIPETPELADIKLGLAGVHQVQNANLAVHLARKFLQTQDGFQPTAQLPKSFIAGLENARWPGRCQIVADPRYHNTTWFLDGAHTTESLDCCTRWFVSPEAALRPTTGKRRQRILIFNCTSGRNGSSFLGTVLSNAAAQLKLYGSDEERDSFFTHVIFCTNVTYADGGFKGGTDIDLTVKNDLAHLKTQQDLATAWSSLVPSFPTQSIHVLPSIEHAIGLIRELASTRDGDGDTNVDVLVSGSLHLVGGVIEVAGLSDVAL